MSGHTPGPWFWAEDARGQKTDLMRSGSGDYVATPQVDIGDFGLSVDRWTDVSDEDAHLIAAAPELLAVAVRLRDYARSGASFNYPLGSLQELEDAIAKATGQEVRS